MTNRSRCRVVLSVGESMTVGLSPFAPRKCAAFAERKATLVSSSVLSPPSRRGEEDARGASHKPDAPARVTLYRSLASASGLCSVVNNPGRAATHAMCRRRGYALTEMLVTIAVGSVLLGIASGLLVLLMSVEQNSRDGLRQQVTLANLATQFRRDAGGCTRFAEGSPGWRFEQPEGTVVQYRVQGTSLIRVLMQDGVAREQEAYQLPDDAQVSLELSTARGPAIVRLLMAAPQGKPTRGPPRAVEIDAALGADRALLTPGGDAGLDHVGNGAVVSAGGHAGRISAGVAAGANGRGRVAGAGGDAGLDHVEVSP